MASKPELSVVKFRKDIYLLIEGKLSDGYFFIIHDGFVKLSKNMQLMKENDMSVMGPGDFVGIVSAMSKRSQIETAQTIADTTLLAVHNSQFEGLIQHNAPIVMKIIQQFSRRIRFLNNALSSFSVSNSIKMKKDDAYVLLQIGDYYSKLNMNQHAHYIYKRYLECYPEGVDVKIAQSKEKLLEKYKEANYEPAKNRFTRIYKKDSLIFAEGESGNELYILTKGLVKITRILDGNELILAVLKDGDIFGEMAILEDKPRSATAVALEDVTLTVVLKENFALIAKTQPQVLYRLTQILSERIWFSYKQLSNMMIKEPIGRIYNYLSIILEKNNIEHKVDMSYVFDFNFKELMNMVSVPVELYIDISKEVLGDKIISQVNGKLYTSNVEEIFKRGYQYMRKQERESSKLVT
jgi:CRP-like cAMP-binding protein